MPSRASASTISSRQAIVEVDQPLGGPLQAHLHHQLGIGGGDAARAAPAAFAAGAPHAAQGHHFRRADHHAVGAQGDGLQHVVRGADAARGDQRHLVADAFGRQELVHLRDGVLDGHGDVLLGDVRRRAGAAVAAVQVDDVGSGVVAAHGHHVHVGGRRYLHAHQALAVHFLDPIDVLLVVFHAVDAVEGERAEQGVARHGLAHARHGGRVLVAQQVPAQAGLGALGVLELDDAHALDGVLAHAEEARGHLRDHMVVVGPAGGRDSRPRRCR